jgi:membrane peptidoglycan carboxypeptidase
MNALRPQQPPSDPPQSSIRPSTRFRWRRWILGVLTVLVCGIAAFGIYLFLHFRPFYQTAEAVDLSLLRVYPDSHPGPVPLAEISPHLVQAVFETDPPRRFDHPLSRVSQQLTGTIPVPRNHGVILFVALRIERSFSKAEQMEIYLNRIYFGSGRYGVRAASRGYFAKEPDELGIEEAATLAVLIGHPYGLSPYKNPEGCRAARNALLTRMHEAGNLTEETKRRLIELPLGVTSP